MKIYNFKRRESMKIRIMGTAQQNSQFIVLLKKMPEVNIYQESKAYTNRGSSKLERVYLELELNQHFTPADVVEELLNYPGIFPYQ